MGWGLVLGGGVGFWFFVGLEGDFDVEFFVVAKNGKLDSIADGVFAE